MHIRSINNISEPLRSPSGEKVYELIGASAQSGNALGHSLAYIVITPGGMSSCHYHKMSEESYYILKGEARITIDGQVFQLNVEQACLIQPPSRHEIFNPGKLDLVFLAVCTPPWTPSDSYMADSE